MTIAEPRWACEEASQSHRFGIMALVPESTKSIETIFWGLANFFLQLFVWGFLTGLFYWASIVWEGFWVLAFVSGLVGIIWAVVPLWLILYPNEVKLEGKVQRPKADRGMPDWLWKTFVVASVLLGMVIFAALSSALL